MVVMSLLMQNVYVWFGSKKINVVLFIPKKCLCRYVDMKLFSRHEQYKDEGK